MADNGEEMNRKIREPYGPWLVVDYGRNKAGSGYQGRKNVDGLGSIGNKNAINKGNLTSSGKSSGNGGNNSYFEKFVDRSSRNGGHSGEKIKLNNIAKSGTNPKQKGESDTISTKATSSRGSRFEILEEDKQDGHEGINLPSFDSGKLLEALIDITNCKGTGNMKVKVKENSTKNKSKPNNTAKNSNGSSGHDSRPNISTPIVRRKVVIPSKKKSV
ncbi:hypothetical protein ACOSQ3_011856 [Xanthoceras sorbifolium]